MRHKILLSVFAALLMLAAILPVSAMSGGTLISTDISCTGVMIEYSDVHFDRDNTGLSIEAYTIQITDGNGTILYSDTGSWTIPLTILGQTEAFGFSVMPAANPIRMQLISIAGNGLPEQVFWDFSGDCPDLPSSTGSVGPHLPAGFVLVNITCDTPVYNTPAGSPVGDAAVTAGQTWFVNPEPRVDEAGQLWTEIFVSSRINPYIPTACVG